MSRKLQRLIELEHENLSKLSIHKKKKKSRSRQILFERYFRIVAELNVAIQGD